DDMAGEAVALAQFQCVVVAGQFDRIGLCLVVWVGMATVAAVDGTGIDDRDVIALDNDTGRTAAWYATAGVRTAIATADGTYVFQVTTTGTSDEHDSRHTSASMKS